MLFEYYKELLGFYQIPKFMQKYLKLRPLERLKGISYFCGMDYASKDVYPFVEKITRYDHSILVALIVYNLTHNRVKTLAGLFHDISSPCFSHVVDYMNGDYATQESTEAFTKKILENDDEFCQMVKEDQMCPECITNFKKYPVVDNERPKLCADRVDGVILPSINWTQNITENEIFEIVSSLTIYKNENKEDEIGFKSEKAARLFYEKSNVIDSYCHSKEDNYMMQKMADILRLAIQDNLFSYEDLYTCVEEDIIQILNNSQNRTLQKMLDEFYHIKKSEIPVIELPYIKKRDINPLFKKMRLII